MRRIASHYIYWNSFFPMHYVELDEEECLAGVFPLEEEIAGTEFYDGLLILASISTLCTGERGAFDMRRGETLAEALERQGFTPISRTGLPVCLLLLSGISPATAKFGADDGRGDGYIQRL